MDKAGLKVKGVVWRPGMPVRSIGRWTAVDTETLMIDENKPGSIPELVLLTAYGGGDTVELVWWYDVDVYLASLVNSGTTFVFHNAPFDMNVTGMDRWLAVVDNDKVVDTGIQWVLHKMATIGLSDEADEYPKLARVVQDVLGETLEKDGEVRCTFTRDMELDDEHAIYACGDAVATWRAAFTMSPAFVMPPTMATQIKGFISLDSISRNGILVDRDWMDSLRNEYLAKKDELKLTLADYGINVDKELETREIISYLQSTILPTLPDNPLADDYRAALVWLGKGEDTEWPVFGQKGKINPAVTEWKNGPPFNLPLKATPKQMVNVLWKIAMNIEAGREKDDGLQEWWEKHDGWPPGYKQEGKTKQLQRLMAESEKFCSQPFPKTKSGMYALDDKALEQIPTQDIERLKFLKALKEYNHAEKMASTYLDSDKLIKADGRVHSRYIPIKATGRTSSRAPNLQNLPRDDRIRSCYVADPGYVLCSCDYNQQELISLAQITYTRFGHSLMRDLINNDIDIHGYMGTTIKGLFKGLPKFDVTDEEIVKMYRTVIKQYKAENPDEFKKLRQLAKALDQANPRSLQGVTPVEEESELQGRHSMPICN